jgi:hypothetical protein
VLRGAGNGGYAVWVANRAAAPLRLELIVPALKGQALRHQTSFVAGAAPGPDPADELRSVASTGDPVSDRAGAEGRFMVSLPARSVSVVRVESSATAS